MHLIPHEIEKIKSILDSFLGSPKSDLDSNYQLEYPCPRCVEKYGNKEIQKYNLSISLLKMKFNCWKCSDEDDNDMHGSLFKLIKIYGNEQLMKEYKEQVESLRNSKLYMLELPKEYQDIMPDEMNLPTGFRPFRKDKYFPPLAMDYLMSRGIDWKIIKEHGIGFTPFLKDDMMVSNRIIIPSRDEYGCLNYWTGRDFTGKKKEKYMNPKAVRKDIVFNEDMVQWDADITLVEGPFDHIVVPNSIPLLGKELKTDFKLYWLLLNKAHANINIFLDGDAYDSAKHIYAMLNHGNLYNRIRYIPTNKDDDPSLIFQKGGRKAIIKHLQNASKIKESDLV